jgi:hypothetical protein
MPLSYAGNDANYPTAVNIISGSDSPTSANFQPGYEGALDRTAALQNRGGLAPMVTLQPVATTASYAVLSNMAGPHGVAFNDTSWGTDPIFGQQWLLLGWDSGHTHVQVWAGFADGGGAWVQMGGNISYTQSGTSIAVDPSSGAVFVAGTAGIGASQADVFRCPAGGSFASWVVVGTSTPTDMQIAILAGAMFYAVGSSTASNAKISGDFGGGFVSLTVPSWIVRSSPTMVLFIPTAPGGGNGVVYKATGTATYTSAALGIGVLDVPQDLTWSAAWGLWFLIVKTNTGGTTIWSSPDGATWTLLRTLTFLPRTPGGIAAIGPHLIATVAAPTFGQFSRVITSSDAGVTWYACPTGVPTNSATGPIVDRPVAGVNQMFLGQTVGRSSVGQPNFRFSSIAGRGDQALT